MNGLVLEDDRYDIKGEAADKAEGDEQKSDRYRRLWRAKARKDWSLSSAGGIPWNWNGHVA
jgi:hypothetical protein